MWDLRRLRGLAPRHFAQEQHHGWRRWTTNNPLRMWHQKTSRRWRTTRRSHPQWRRHCAGHGHHSAALTFLLRCFPVKHLNTLFFCSQTRFSAKTHWWDTKQKHGIFALGELLNCNTLFENCSMDAANFAVLSGKISAVWVNAMFKDWQENEQSSYASSAHSSQHAAEINGTECTGWPSGWQLHPGVACTSPSSPFIHIKVFRICTAWSDLTYTVNGKEMQKLLQPGSDENFDGEYQRKREKFRRSSAEY